MAQPKSGGSMQGGLINFSLKAIATIIFFLLVSLFFSLVSEWVGMNFFWPDERATHAKRMYEQELQYLNEDFTNTLVTSDAVQFAENMSDGFYEIVFVKTRLEDFFAWAARPVPEGAGGMRETFHRVFQHLSDFVIASMYCIKTFAVRLAVLVMAMPLFLIFALVGICDGLVQRDVRRWCGGRESSLVYSYSKHLVFPSLLGAWVIYLALPVSVHPNLVLLPFAMLFALSLAVMAATFKKYI